MEYRQELKYVCSSPELDILRSRLLPLMKLDSHLGRDQTYNIRSIYLDDYADTCLEENESGINERVKIRIRIYDRSPSRINLEFKYKRNGMTHKESTPISEEMCRRIMSGEAISIWETGGDRLLNQLAVLMQTRLLRPKVIVEYERTVFVSETGNVRVTFDWNIRGSHHIERFFEPNLYAAAVLEPGKHVLEVKYDELLPDYIAQALDNGRLERTAFSKYYLSRITLKENEYEV